ncbi:MAG: hypothetical protein R2850_05765 [Bacteroidia bacterium]
MHDPKRLIVSTPSFTLGVEEEYMVVHPETREDSLPTIRKL